MRKYDSEFKQQAVKKILDGQSVASVSRELGVAENLLHNWKKARTIASADLERENLELRKRLKEIEMERERVKKGSSYLRARKLKRYIFIAVEKTNYSVRALCRVMQF